MSEQVDKLKLLQQGDETISLREAATKGLSGEAAFRSELLDVIMDSQNNPEDRFLG